MGGYCVEHHEERETARVNREDALRLLHRGVIDDGRPELPEHADELKRLWHAWSETCSVTNHQFRSKLVPAEEAEYAVEWCIIIAIAILDAERAAKAGRKPDYMVQENKKHAWRRFDFLEQGLRSNGTPRK